MSQGIMVIPVYKPILGKEEELLTLTKEHVQILRFLGLATSRPALAMRAQDGSIVEVFEWVSAEAIQKAHTNPDVLAMWKRYEACCTYGKLSDLAEADNMFAGFTPIDL